jgi:hypothetical protein
MNIDVIESAVTKKQNSTNLRSKASLKSCVERSLNSNTGSATLNTNLFIPEDTSSFKKPMPFKKAPSIINKNIGMVTFKLKTKFSSISYLLLSF